MRAKPKACSAGGLRMGILRLSSEPPGNGDSRTRGVTMRLIEKEVGMKKIANVLLIVFSSAVACFAQASGNVGYSQSGGNAKAEQNERNKRALSQTEVPPTANSMF